MVQLGIFHIHLCVINVVTKFIILFIKVAVVTWSQTLEIVLISSWSEIFEEKVRKLILQNFLNVAQYI